MATKRVSVTQDEQRIILGALENNIWTIDAAKNKHIGVEDSELDRQKADVEQVFIKLRKKFKGY